MGLFDSIRNAVKKTADLLNTDIRDLFKSEGRLIDDDFLTEVYAVLVRTDMGGGPAREIRDQLARDFRGRVVFMKDLLDVVKQKIKEIMAQPDELIQWADSGPTVIMVVGVNGSGKTTSIARLANRFKEQGKSVVLGAGDTFRAAAVQQLTVWAERIGVDIVKADQGSDPAAVAHRAVAAAIENNNDVCILDTAGRLQTQVNLMKQLEKIYRVIGKLIPEAPHETLLVLDATAGQNGLSQAEGFREAANCTGIVLAKLDGTAKGGVAIPIRQRFELPVKFVGTGETEKDMEVFEVEPYVEALFEDVG